MAEFGSLAGLNGGWVMDRRLLIGGGAYWLTNGSSDLKMAYGGAVAEWFANPGGPIDFSVRSLVGAGNATLSDDVRILPFEGRPPFFRHERPHVERIPQTVRFREGFFIAEPQANDPQLAGIRPAVDRAAHGTRLTKAGLGIGNQELGW